MIDHHRRVAATGIPESTVSDARSSVPGSVRVARWRTVGVLAAGLLVPVACSTTSPDTTSPDTTSPDTTITGALATTTTTTTITTTTPTSTTSTATTTIPTTIPTSVSTTISTTIPTTIPTSISTSTSTTTTSTTTTTTIIENVLAGADWVVIEVSDGDTIVVDGPQGEQRVRLVGINTPERGECYSDEATRALTGLVGRRPVRLVRDQSDTDQYGRLLRFVEVLDGAGRVVDAGAALVGSGHALSRRYSPDTSRNDRYDTLQDEAQADGRGLWAPDACGDPSVFGAGEVRLGLEIRADAPGDDGLNPNGEWVRFTNEAPNPLDLTGWEIADESASHRYRFGRFVLAPGASFTLFTGCGADSASELFWCNEGSAVWNNSGDTVFVKDPNGNIVIAETYRD